MTPLLAFLRRNKMTQQSAAMKVGIDAAQFNRYCRGKVEPHREIKERIAQALGASVGEIFQPFAEFEQEKEELDRLYQFLTTDEGRLMYRRAKNWVNRI